MDNTFLDINLFDARYAMRVHSGNPIMYKYL